MDKKSYVLNFTKEKETKNTIRYTEDAVGQNDEWPGQPVIGYIYFQKFAIANLGNPERLEIIATNMDAQWITETPAADKD